jgi:hypothetical protein
MWGHHTYLYKPKANQARTGWHLVIERRILNVMVN